MTTERMDLEPVKAFLVGVSPGPWVVPATDNVSLDTVVARADTSLGVPVCEVRSPGQNARFIAQARTFVPRMVREIEDHRNTIAEQSRVIERLQSRADTADDLTEEVARLRERHESADLVNEAIRWKRRALHAEGALAGVRLALAPADGLASA